jgi:UDP-glucose 4-epimerase
MRVLVTGAAGFIGSTLTDRLLSLGHTVVGVDNLSTGQPEFIAAAKANPLFTLRVHDLLDLDALVESTNGMDLVVHLAANADVRFGPDHPRRDLEQNIIVTWNVLEAMRRNGVKRVAFSSTGSVYGESPVIPTPEDAPFPVQTSLYGASKVSAEGLISAYCESFGFEGYIYRFVSILGERYTHGHVLDFYKSLMADPARLRVLGNGKQRKSYLYVQDCVDAILLTLEKAKDKVNLFNLGTNEYCQVTDSIGWITAHLGVSPQLEFTGGDRGWIGDNPFIFLETKKVRSLGWEPKLSIQQAVIKTVEYLQQNPWVGERR